jgi:hypothetical protein
MVSAGRQPKKEIAEAIKRAREAGLDVNEIHRGHRWGEVVCASCPASRDVYSTPRNAPMLSRSTGSRSTTHTEASPRGSGPLRLQEGGDSYARSRLHPGPRPATRRPGA